MAVRIRFLLIIVTGAMLLAANSCRLRGPGTRSPSTPDTSAGDTTARKPRAQRDAALRAPEVMSDVAPNEARIRATVTAVYEEREASGPCARAACLATIRIDSVLGYGAAFPRPLSPGEHVAVRFGFTLESTAEIGLEIDETYPGLEPGDAFWANLQGRPAPGGASFVVYGYYPVYE